MLFGQIGGGVTVQPGPKNSRIFSDQFLVIHSVRHIFRHIYVDFDANMKHQFPKTFTRDPEMHSSKYNVNLYLFEITSLW
jgi:hypothetical protein